jgi:lipoprotein signal peptidase
MVEMTSRQHYLSGSIVALAILLVDQVSKHMAIAEQSQVILNTGISFGLAADSPIISLISIGVLLILLWWWIQQPNMGLALIWAGGLSNLLDRWQWQGVIDWLPIPFTSLHNNIADIAIFVGLGWWAYTTFVITRRAKREVDY